MSSKAVHDLLLEMKPSEASHDVDGCSFCSPDLETANASTGGIETVPDKTYTEAEYDALLAKVSDLETKVAAHEAAAKESDEDAKVAAKTAELQKAADELQAKLDATTIEAEAAKKDRDDIVAYLEAEVAAAKEAEEAAARKEERLTLVREAASFPESYLEENADRFASMDEETFEVTLEGFKAQKAALATASSTEEKEEVIPVSTAMTAARSTNQDPNPLLELPALRREGNDLRTV